MQILNAFSLQHPMDICEQGLCILTGRDDTPLRPIRIFLLTHLLDTDFHAIFREADVLLFHVGFPLIGEIVGPEVHLRSFVLVLLL
jgi:hypothetical protein